MKARQWKAWAMVNSGGKLIRVTTEKQFNEGKRELLSWEYIPVIITEAPRGK